MYVGEKIGYSEVCLMKKELYAVTLLQDFARTIGIPNRLKRDNAKTQTGKK